MISELETSETVAGVCLKALARNFCKQSNYDEETAMVRKRAAKIHLAIAAVLLAGGVFVTNFPTGAAPGRDNDGSRGHFQFEPLAASAPCTPGGNASQPFILPAGFSQSIVASEPQFPDVPDMNTLNENGPQAGRFLYRTHETGTNGAVSVTDLLTGNTSVLVQSASFRRLDGIVWTPWGTILFAEETGGGLVYEVDPAIGVAVPRPAIGLKSHEGMRFDPQGNLYSISENFPGYIFKFVPDSHGDLSSGRTFALKITNPTGDRVGEAEWVELGEAQVQVNADVAAAAAGATGYNRPEDVEIATATGNNRGGANVLYVAITGRPTDNRVIAVDLREPKGGRDHVTAFVYDYVKIGLNAPPDFEMPDNLALDKNGNLFIAEDPATAPATGRGDDIWCAIAASGGQHRPASAVVRFASLTDCNAEPTGIYFDLSGRTLFVNAQHRGGDGLDKSVAITRN
jgi:secreted PhoX family phosphatase